MSSLLQVIVFSLVGGVVSLVGGVILLSSKKSASKLTNYATPFAAGALLSAAFLDLLKEAAHQGSIDTGLMFALIGIVLFFLMERFLQWFHHHHEHDNKKTDPTLSLVIVGDTLHNFIDGVAIAAGFLVSPSTGIIVSLAVAAHEIPQEIGDFGLLLNKGLSRKKVLIVNFLSALASVFAAVVFFIYGQTNSLPLDAALGLVAGLFIYIAVSDIIPSIHKNEKRILAGSQTLMLIVGVVVVGVTTSYLHGAIEAEIDNTSPEIHEHTSESHTHIN